MNLLLSFLVGVSTGTWLFAKVLQPRTQNTAQSAIAAAVVGFIVFIVVLVLANILIPDA